MTDFVLPTLEDMQAVDLTSLTISDSDVGLLTAWQGAIIKNLIDQMSADETIHIKAPWTSTGKTEKFIVENCNVLPTIVTTDRFVDSVLDCSGFYTLPGNNDKVFKNSLNPLNLTTDANGDVSAASVAVKSDWKNSSGLGDTIDIDLSAGPQPLSSAQISGLNNDADFNCASIVNHAGTAYGTADDVFAQTLSIAYCNPIGLGYPAWEDHEKLLNVASMYNNLPVNGALIVFSYNLGGTITAAHSLMNALNTTGRSYEYIRYRPTEDVSFDTIVFKKLS